MRITDRWWGFNRLIVSEVTFFGSEFTIRHVEVTSFGWHFFCRGFHHVLSFPSAREAKFPPPFFFQMVAKCARHVIFFKIFPTTAPLNAFFDFTQPLEYFTKLFRMTGFCRATTDQKQRTTASQSIEPCPYLVRPP